MAIEPGSEHIGEEYAAQSHIDRCVKGRNGFAHAKPLKRLAPAQQFAVDLADRLQDLAGTVMIGQELCRLGVKLLRDVVHLRPQSRVADREIVLGAMAGAVGAFASRPATSFVAFDERTAEDRLERRQLAQESVAAFSQCGSGLVLNFHQTTYITGLILRQLNTFFNLFVWD